MVFDPFPLPSPLIPQTHICVLAGPSRSSFGPSSSISLILPLCNSAFPFTWAAAETCLVSPSHSHSCFLQALHVPFRVKSKQRAAPCTVHFLCPLGHILTSLISPCLCPALRPPRPAKGTASFLVLPWCFAPTATYLSIISI